MNTNLVEQVQRHEGLRLMPYKDTVGKLTIGYGRNLEDIGISKDEAEIMLLNDLHTADTELRNRYPTTNHLSAPRRDVLINMCFNLGITRLSGFKKMWRAINDGDYHLAAKEMLDSKWANQVGQRATELATQMLTGEYQE